MAVAQNNRRLAASNTTTSQTYTSGNFTPIGNVLLVLMVRAYTSDARTIATPVVTSSVKQQWSFVAASGLATDSKTKYFLFTSVTNSAPTIGTITIDAGAGSTYDQAGWAISELTGARTDNNGINAIRTVGSTATTAAAATLTGSLATPYSSNSLAMYFYWISPNENPTYSGGTIGMSFGGAPLVGNFGYGFKNNDTAPVATWVTSGLGMMFPFEVMEALPVMMNNYQFLKVGDGMSTSEKIR